MQKTKKLSIIFGIFIISFFILNSPVKANNNYAGVFLGGSGHFDLGGFYPTIGAAYERRFNQMGLGLFFDVVIASSSGIALGVPAIFFHPSDISGLKFIIAGLLHTYGRNRGSIFSHMGARIGAGYDIDIKSILITPTVYLDWAGNSRAVVLGVYAGKNF